MNQRDRQIVIFDSGVGGITVLYKALKALPKEEFIYYADVKNVPYGTKSKETVRDLILTAISGLDHIPIKALVMACNTGTSVAISDLREKYDYPIIGMEPAIKPAIEQNKPGKVLVLATDLTLKEDKYQSLINDLHAEDQITQMAMPELVEAAEEYNFGDRRLINAINEKFNQIEWKGYHTIVLGCTHFVYFKPMLKKLLPDHLAIIDGNQGTVNRLQSLISPNENGTSIIRCMLSGYETDADLVQPYLSFLDRWY